ncbi:MAG: hypothetical protein LQ348_003270 [Seirophora lacunosa]|nr:MAG: hypothetical protein LQ348_003270 [Seirophora lacunosa]
MVCAKCQKQLKSTTLATPAVKKKTEMYYGSPAGSNGRIEKASSAGGSTGAGKSKLLSKSAKNPYAQYASSCKTCKTKTDSGRTYCQRCAYKANKQNAKTKKSILSLFAPAEGLIRQEQRQQATHLTKSRSLSGHESEQ